MSQCPFYGYRPLPEMRKLIGSSDGRCALRDGYAPCMMEIDGDEPELEACSFNGQDAPSNTPASQSTFSRSGRRTNTRTEGARLRRRTGPQRTA